MSIPGTRLTRLERGPRPHWLPDDATIIRHLADREPRFRYRKPRYQLQLIRDMAQLIPDGPCRILDVGAGSGLLGDAIATLFPGKSVTGVDVAARALPTLKIPIVKFDGRRVPFADGAFDCALFSNVLHHVKPELRTSLLREALRVTRGGPIVIKDHLARAPLDGLRLWFLDFVGNAPFGAMVSASYLAGPEWAGLLQAVEGRGHILPESAYRSGLADWCFPNRLEICFSLAATPARSSHHRSAGPSDSAA